MPVAMEVHPVNDNAHGKLEAWAPDSEKMQAELEGNRGAENPERESQGLLFPCLGVAPDAWPWHHSAGESRRRRLTPML